MDPIYVGQILLWPIQWAPEGWALCNGQELPIVQYQALYSLIGTRYGPATSKQYFCIPNLPGITIAGTGRGPGLINNYPISNKAIGTTSVPLTFDLMPAHAHAAQYNLSASSLNASVQASASAATVSNANAILSAVPAAGATNDASVPADFYGPVSSPVQLTNAINAGLISNIESMTVKASTGTGKGHNNMQPYLNLNYIIALDGPYPEFQ